MFHFKTESSSRKITAFIMGAYKVRSGTETKRNKIIMKRNGIDRNIKT